MTIYLEGKIRTRSYDKDGIKHYSTEIVADSFTMLGKKENNQSTPGDDIGGVSDSNINGADGLPF